MAAIEQSAEFERWLLGLSDLRARANILARIDRLAGGNPGDAKPVGGGVSELRIHYGPGYRLYYATIGKLTVLLLCGGDKSTQTTDIAKAKAILQTRR